MCAARDLVALAVGANLALSMVMERMSPDYIDVGLDIDPARADAHAAPTIEDWLDERTVRIDFDRPSLSPEVKLVFGYLTMEQHGLFAGLSSDEQQEIANSLKK